jgi:transcriptional regulator NrdR family protein
MNCPKCGYGHSNVIDSRPIENGKRRRHVCSGCGFRYTGIEIPVAEYKKMKKLYTEAQKIINGEDQSENENY